MTTTIHLRRVFRLGATDLPDPSPDMTVEQVLSHYAQTFPQLHNGSVYGGEVENDALVWHLKPIQYKANG